MTDFGRIRIHADGWTVDGCNAVYIDRATAELASERIMRAYMMPGRMRLRRTKKKGTEDNDP